MWEYMSTPVEYILLGGSALLGMLAALFWNGQALLLPAWRFLWQFLMRFCTRTLPLDLLFRFGLAFFWIYILPDARKGIKRKIRIGLAWASEKKEAYILTFHLLVRRHWMRLTIQIVLSVVCTVAILLVTGFFILFTNLVMPLLRFVGKLFRYALNPALNQVGYHGVDELLDQLEEWSPDVVRTWRVWRIKSYRRGIRHRRWIARRIAARNYRARMRNPHAYY